MSHTHEPRNMASPIKRANQSLMAGSSSAGSSSGSSAAAAPLRKGPLPSVLGKPQQSPGWPAASVPKVSYYY